LEGRAGYRFVVRIDLARGEMGVRSRLSLEHDLLAGHGPFRYARRRCESTAGNAPPCSPDLALSAFKRVPSPSKTGVNALKDALWRNRGFVFIPQSGVVFPHFAALNAGYGSFF